MDKTIVGFCHVLRLLLACLVVWFVDLCLAEAIFLFLFHFNWQWESFITKCVRNSEQRSQP